MKRTPMPPRSEPIAKIGKKRAAENEAAGVTQYNTIRDRVGTERGEFNRAPRPPADPRKAPFNARIRARDKFCLLCGGRGEEVHHLFTVGAHKELEFVEANVILVCSHCHRTDDDAIHPNNVTVCRRWRAKEYEPFGAIYDFESDRPLFEALRDLKDVNRA
jgi:hypothetical protein